MIFLPLQVAIVFSGYDTPGGREMLRQDESLWHTIPLHDLLTDRIRNEEVYHCSKPGDPLTIVAIYSQPVFSRTMIEVTRHLLEQPEKGKPIKLVYVQCWTGHH